MLYGYMNASMCTNGYGIKHIMINAEYPEVILLYMQLTIYVTLSHLRSRLPVMLATYLIYYVCYNFQGAVQLPMECDITSHWNADNMLLQTFTYNALSHSSNWLQGQRAN